MSQNNNEKLKMLIKKNNLNQGLNYVLYHFSIMPPKTQKKILALLEWNYFKENLHDLFHYLHHFTLCDNVQELTETIGDKKPHFYSTQGLIILTDEIVYHENQITNYPTKN